HRVAVAHGIGGWVRNESGRVSIRAEGGSEALEGFLAALESGWPPMSRVDRLAVDHMRPLGYEGFSIAESLATSLGGLPVSPDLAMCASCELELLDASNRRYRYPFITCTDCGPRYTVIEGMPYDRVRTRMAPFTQCPACMAEYESPRDRRYHSETNACQDCGPRLWLEIDGDVTEDWEALERAGRLLGEGATVAIRGLGGFHLAASAVDEGAVGRLRRRKGRDEKPLAVMVRDLVHARRWVEVDDQAASLLSGPARPIVLLPSRGSSGLASSVAPGLQEIGVMLAYTPLHRLLFEIVDVPLVMTSGNGSDEPIAIANDEVRERLASIADAFLLHDREIASRYDDSVVRPGREGPVFLRRARGFAPLPIDLPLVADTPILAVGPHLKNTFTLAHGRRAFVSQHIGDLDTLEALQHFEDTLARYRRLFGIDPRVVVHDLHPGYLSTRVALEVAARLGAEVIGVQHHHAHIVAVAAEAGRVDPVVGLAFDGLGYGEDGLIWGAEAMVADPWTYRRRGRLAYAPMPGGDLASRSPWRAALGYATLDDGDRGWVDGCLEGIEARQVAAARWQIESGTNAPLTSSMGRLFDAAAAVLGVRRASSYEGQAAMELEALAGTWGGLGSANGRGTLVLPFPLRTDGEDGWVMDPVPLLRALARERTHGTSTAALAAAFHESVAVAAASLAQRVAEAEGVDTVALGGGVFQNSRLRSRVRERLESAGLDVLIPRKLSPNDGCVSYGQAVVAAARLTPTKRET
ncbi:MAG: carbamoyltransferase HypF, partial [Gemmatimonadota bacterium]|nr:carbamoyltransferase HypF [Gemmatimonadota bacterium]